MKDDDRTQRMEALKLTLVGLESLGCPLREQQEWRWRKVY